MVTGIKSGDSNVICVVDVSSIIQEEVNDLVPTVNLIGKPQRLKGRLVLRHAHHCSKESIVSSTVFNININSICLHYLSNLGNFT